MPTGMAAESRRSTGVIRHEIDASSEFSTYNDGIWEPMLEWDDTLQGLDLVSGQPDLQSLNVVL